MTGVWCQRKWNPKVVCYNNPTSSRIYKKNCTQFIRHYTPCHINRGVRLISEKIQDPLFDAVNGSSNPARTPRSFTSIDTRPYIISTSRIQVGSTCVSFTSWLVVGGEWEEAVCGGAFTPFITRVSCGRPRTLSHTARHVILPGLLQGGICHFTKWQIPPFNTKVTH